MAEIPDDLHPLGASRGNKRIQAGPVEVPRAGLDEMPADGVASTGDPHLPEPPVVFLDEAVVLRRRHHIEAVAGAGDVAGWFKSGKAEGAEDGRLRHEN